MKSKTGLIGAIAPGIAGIGIVVLDVEPNQKSQSRFLHIVSLRSLKTLPFSVWHRSFFYRPVEYLLTFAPCKGKV